MTKKEKKYIINRVGNLMFVLTDEISIHDVEDLFKVEVGFFNDMIGMTIKNFKDLINIDVPFRNGVLKEINRLQIFYN